MAGIGAVDGFVSVLGAFTSDTFTLLDLLVEIGALGVALYIAVVPLGFILALFMMALPSLSDRAIIGLAIGGELVLALVLRFGLFADGLTEDLDAVGTGFLALVGVAVALACFYGVSQLRKKVEVHQTSSPSATKGADAVPPGGVPGEVRRQPPANYPPGWYADPSDSRALCWWDGAAWQPKTKHYPRL